MRSEITGRFVADTPALQRFISKCRFEPETGCVVWTGSTSQGRGHHIPYGQFWFEGKVWWAHRWAARYIHGQDIDDFQTDHCCDTIPIPNTLCVEHLQSITARRNRELQHQRRMIHLQVGLLQYEDIYGPLPEPDPDAVPFYNPPAWLNQGPTHAAASLAAEGACPF